MKKTTVRFHQLSLRGALSPILGFALVATVPSALVSPAFAQQSASRSDLAIESDVLHQLASVASLHNQAVSASTENGVVTLTGSVADDATAQLAQQTAAAVNGVRSVINHLTVGGTSTPAPDSTPSDATSQAKPSAAQAAGPASAAPQQAPPADQTQATDPTQPAFPQNSQPQPGTKGDWGQAGPPPDVQNGQIPPPPSGAQDSAPGAAQPQNPPPAPPPAARNYPPPAGPPAAPPPPGNQPPPAGQPSYGPPAGYGPSAAAAPVTLPAGTVLRVRTVDPLDSRKIQQGTIFDVVAAQDIFENGVLAVPRGANLQGQVLGVKKAGAFTGSAGLALQLTNLNLSGQAYPLATDVFASDTRGKGGYTAANTVSAAAIGALIGAAVGGGSGAAIGAVAGGVGGAGISAATPSPREVLPPETLLLFHLKAPVTITPVSYQEAQRLATSTARRQPIDSRLNNRYYGYPMPPPPPPYPY
jgi:hypothetical protein